MGEDLQFIFTYSQQVIVCEHFGKNINDLQDWQIQELLDRLIDEAVKA